jgi:hypothetical protein
VLPLASAGTAGAAFYRGPVESSTDAGVEFHTSRPSLHRINDFGWFNVPVPTHCAASGEFPVRMKISNQDKFHGSQAIPDTNYSVTIRGTFRRHGRKAVGTIRLVGSFAGGCSDADTGALHWVAKRGG